MTEEIETDINSISKAFNANAEEIIQTNSSKPVHSCCFCFVFYTERFFKWYRNLEYQKMKESILRTGFFP